MHDIDRTQLEYQPETEMFDSERFEFATEGPGETGGVFGEAELMDLAGELLEVSDEAEVDRFLGNLIRKAGQAVGKFVKSPVGQQLGGILKGAARQALPVVGKALGGYLGGAQGAQLGGQLATTAAGKFFGQELEGWSLEDQEFEAAKGFVRFAGQAVQNAASAAQGADPRAVAQAAIGAAARRYAPGLLPQAAGPMASSTMAAGHGRSGRWVRRGTKIVLYGA